MFKNRYLHDYISDDLREKMVFVGGPRQVGKTTLAKIIGRDNFKNPVYLNWDYREDRQIILEQKFASEANLIIFDEIHKYRQWRNYLKGEFDKNKEKHNILVTGSARLDLYRRGGDSLLGRYHYYRLHPFSVAEAMLTRHEIKIFQDFKLHSNKESRAYFERLFKFGGFPEPFTKQDERTARRFRNERLERLVKEDIRDLENVRDLSSLQILVDIIPGKVGSLFSLNSLVGDLGATHKTVSSWVDILERFYYHFRIYPFASTKIKSLRKEPKIYLWDWAEINDEAARLENIIASHLLKLVHFLQDTEGYKVELNFLRDREGREVDFIVSFDKKPWFAVEVKLSDDKVSKNLNYFTDKLKIPFVYQVIKKDDVDFIQGNVRVISADKFLSGLV